MSDYFKTYNKTLKELIDLISNELPRDTLMETIKRKYTAAITSDRTLLLTETGKEVFTYRDYIAQNRWDELINKDWESDTNADIVDVDQKSIQKLIIVLRQIWAKYDSDEKKYIKKLIKILLTEYTKFLMAQQ
jgi:hypothetical protein